MCKFLICLDRLRSECLLLLNINFVSVKRSFVFLFLFFFLFFNESSKLYFDLHDKLK